MPMVVLLALLVGCSSPPQPAPPLPELQLAHTTRLPWLDTLIAQDVTHQLGSFALYEAPAQQPKVGSTSAAPGATPGAVTSTPVTQSMWPARMLAIVALQMIDIGLDGSDPRTVKLAVRCIGDITVTADGSRAACSTLQGVEIFSVRTDASEPNSYLGLPDAPGGRENFGDPSWSPDGSLLTVRHGPIGHGEIEVGSHVGIYRLPNIGSPQLLLDLRFLQLAVDEVLWSPDGNWLIVEGSSDGEHFRLYAYWLAPWLSALHLAMPNTPPLQVSVTNAQLPLLSTRADGPFTWHSEQAGQAVVTFSNGLRRAVMERAVESQAVTTLFTQHAGLICGLAWTRDGTALVFQLCGPAGDDTPGPPAHLYLYQPPSRA